MTNIWIKLSLSIEFTTGLTEIQTPSETLSPCRGMPKVLRIIWLSTTPDSHLHQGKWTRLFFSIIHIPFFFFIIELRSVRVRFALWKVTCGLCVGREQGGRWMYWALLVPCHVPLSSPLCTEGLWPSAFWLAACSAFTQCRTSCPWEQPLSADR